MTKPGTIILDMLILGVLAGALALGLNFATSLVKKAGDRSDPIVTAIMQSDTNRVAVELGKTNACPDKPDNFGRTPLMWASYANYNKTPVVQKLLAEADAARAPIVRMLLEHQAAINARDNDGWTALMWASWSGLPGVAAVLLEHGAVTTPADKQGNTALILAAQRGQAEVVRILLAKGADKSATTPAGKTALDFAKAGRAQYPKQSAAYDATLSLLQ